MKIYPEYEQFLRLNDIPNAIKSILKDEEEHLKEMEAEIGEDRALQSHLPRLRDFEEKQFNIFLATARRQNESTL